MTGRHISHADGELLVRAARKIATRFVTGGAPEPDPGFESRFAFSCGVFVTIDNKDGLRGCIGYVLPDRNLSEALADAAASAVTDPRFEPVTPDELDCITFEVTVLTAPKEIAAGDPSEYPSKIRIGRDGLIIKSKSSSGLLLPQVPVEYGWSATEFLGHACEKAGLERDAWKKKGTIVSRFEGIIFGEEAPNGNITRHALGD